jgi:hypothetical protein
MDMSDGEEGVEDKVLPLLGRFASLEGRWEEEKKAELKVAAGAKEKARMCSRTDG